MDRERRIKELEQHECKIPNDVAAKLDAAESKTNFINYYMCQIENLLVFNTNLIKTESSTTWEDKFSKMKNLYTNLREEHIGLLRKVFSIHAACHMKIINVSKSLQCVKNGFRMELQTKNSGN